MKWTVVAFALCLAASARADDANPQSAEQRLAAALEKKIERSNDLRSAGISGASESMGDNAWSSRAVWRWSLGTGACALILIISAVWTKRVREQKSISTTDVGLSVQESIWVGRGQRLMVIKAGGNQYLLGATGSGLETLADLGPAERSEPDEELQPHPADSTTFKEFVNRAMVNDASPRKRRKEILDGLRAL